MIATRVGGIVDQIVDGEHGVLIDEPDDLEAFAAAITRLLGDEREARRLGEEAYVRAH